MKAHENILVFYSKLPNYNPQMREGEPYKCKQGKQTGVYGMKNNRNIITNNDGGRYPLSYIKFKSTNGKNKHPTQKPVKLFEYLIKTYTNKNEIVLDSVMGSGTTAVACMKTDRKFIGFEQEEKYYNITLKRLGKFDKKYIDKLPESEKPKQTQIF